MTTTSWQASSGGDVEDVSTPENPCLSRLDAAGAGFQPVSYTHLTLPTTPYV